MIIWHVQASRKTCRECVVSANIVLVVLVVYWGEFRSGSRWCLWGEEVQRESEG